MKKTKEIYIITSILDFVNRSNTKNDYYKKDQFQIIHDVLDVEFEAGGFCNLSSRWCAIFVIKDKYYFLYGNILSENGYSLCNIDSDIWIKDYLAGVKTFTSKVSLLIWLYETNSLSYSPQLKKLIIEQLEENNKFSCDTSDFLGGNNVPQINNDENKLRKKKVRWQTSQPQRIDDRIEPTESQNSIITENTPISINNLITNSERQTDNLSERIRELTNSLSGHAAEFISQDECPFFEELNNDLEEVEDSHPDDDI